MSNKFIHPSQTITRRTLLQGFATGSLLLLLQSCAKPIQQTENLTAPHATSPDLEIRLAARTDSTQILPGKPTDTWSYYAEVIQGEANRVDNLVQSYLGPILYLRKGEKVRIHFQNELPEETTVHWHGMLVPSAMDGHPGNAVKSGESYIYEFEVKNRAGTYWFHPHPHGTTGKQVINGLAGLIIVSDEKEAALALPTGEFDLPLVIQDRTLNTLNQFVYNAEPMTGMGSMASMNMDMNMETIMGFLGKEILVNGQPQLTLPVASRVYRLRLLNGSNARIYKLAWNNNMPLTVIATDGGLLEKPIQRDYVTLAPAERIELWVDLSQYKIGDTLTLRSLEYSGVETSMMVDAPNTLSNGAAFDILTVHIEREEQETRTLPTQLAPLRGNQPADAINFNSPRPFELTMSNMQWLINGKQFEMEAVDESEKVALNTLEVWEFINQQGIASGNMESMGHGTMGGQGMMNDFMAHPMHIHGVQFQVIERQVDPAYLTGWQTLKDGYVDEGWKDTVLVMPGERVKILLRFTEYAGRYLMHCHNLEHETSGMMRNYLIEG